MTLISAYTAIRGVAVSSLALLLSLWPLVAFAGFGVSPPKIEDDRLVPGSRLESTIYLVQGKPDRDVPVEIIIDSKNIKEWISFENGPTFTIPTGVQQYPLNVIIDVPSNADFGVYKAFLRISTEPDKAKNPGQVAISIGARVDVALTVGDNVISGFDVKKITLLDAVTNGSPTAKVSFVNTGNVPITPTLASFELFNKFGNIRLGYVENDNFEELPPFAEQDITLEFPIDVTLAEGEYWGHVKIYNEEGKVVRDLKTVFDVVPGGGLAGLAAGVGGASTQMLLGGAGVVLILGFLALFIRSRRKPRRRKRRVPPTN